MPTAEPPPVESSIPAVFAATAARHADRPAVIGEQRTLTYRELAAAAAGVEAAVRAAGPDPASGHVPGDVPGRVGLLLEHGPGTVAAILGTLAAGRAYVPLDPDWPAGRLAEVVADSRPEAVVTTGSLAPLAAEITGSAGNQVPLLVDPPDGTPGGAPGGAPGPDTVSYLLYTSGSTGRPKGVMQNHRNVLFGIGNHVRNFRITPADRLSVLTSFSFDMAVTDMFAAVLTGAAVVPVDLRRHGLSGLAQVLTERGVTIYHSTPTVYRYLVRSLAAGERLPTIRAAVLGGEPVVPGDVTAFRRLTGPDAVFVNGYGATEVSFAVQNHLPADAPLPDGPVPIGRPLAGLDVRLEGGAAPDEGEIGEIVVVSPHVAVGYWDNPAANAERFDTRDGRRCYRTGDLARRLPGGTLSYLGRRDRQVKVRGYRVELGEVEAALAAQPGVARAAVAARTAADGATELIGYVVPAAPGAVDTAALRHAVADRLPVYAVPRTVVALPDFPLTATGKVDVRALPDPGTPEISATEPSGDRTAADAIAAICADVLGVPIPHDENFFDAGGHSLQLAEIHRRLTTDAGLDLPLTALYEHPTVAALAAHVDSAEPVVAAGGTAAEPADDADKIAIVGMACRVPGADTPDELWANLLDGVDSIRDWTEDELRAAGIGERLLADPAYVRSQGHLDGLADFDGDFFGYPADEAALIDPQQRLFLQAAWHALEDAGHDPGRFDGTAGVFAGSAPNRYLLFHLMPHRAGSDPDFGPDTEWEDQMVPGAAPDYLPTRAAYKLGLTGPAVAVQTACSSSLVAVCQAAQSLLDYRCDLALAGGVAVTSTRAAGYRHDPDGLTSPDGRCRPFAAEAAGTVYGNGVGVVVLRRLADAVADGDRIHAVLSGFAVNNDGPHRAGFTAPGVDGQAAVVAEALAAAGADPASVGYVEAHGAGTRVGDAIELSALAKAFRERGGELPSGYCAVGSAKSNLGNLDAAAGVIGLVKAAYAVREGTVPGTLHLDRPSPLLELERSPFRLSARSHRWTGPDGPRRAGVSSFGLGGTNAHVVLEQPPEPDSRPEPAGTHVLLLSARDSDALAATADRLAEHLAVRPGLRIDDVAGTLAAGRRWWPHRRAVPAANLTEAVAVLRGEAPAGALPDAVRRWVDGGGRTGRVAEDVVDAAVPGGGFRRVPLPGYPFRPVRAWVDPPHVRSARHVARSR